MKYKFKIGDRVRTLKTSWIKAGVVGTVTDNSHIPDVKFDDPDIQRIFDGDYPIEEDNLELIEEPVTPEFKIGGRVVVRAKNGKPRTYRSYDKWEDEIKGTIEYIRPDLDLVIRSDEPYSVINTQLVHPTDADHIESKSTEQDQWINAVTLLALEAPDGLSLSINFTK